ncbi:MAG: hypothetical protein CML66_23210 [Rhodobacteraceae bacterium]|nr:hypothetical protein [Paracoccaceae bacterium]MAY47878.1 hypothetical protein [Paracoccaceae bacterium]QEW22898.1 hypothetical protein LA6_005132 [Marinibacterium anthonyi]
MFKNTLVMAVVFGGAALAPPVLAQSARCLPRDLLVQTLETKYSESLTGGGLQSAQQLVEVWSSQAGSFTVFVTRSDGFACIVATGQAWQTQPIKVDDSGVAG